MYRSVSYRVFCLLFLFPLTALGFEVKVVDQFGEAVKDAVVSIPEGTIEPVAVEKINATPAIMDQIERRFVPLVLAVEKGREVVFPNSDNIRHHVYSFSKPKSFQIKLYKGVPNEPLTFDQDGIVVLGCNIHDSMIGYIFVSPWPSFEVTPASGQVRFDSRPAEVAVWHPWVPGLKEPLVFSMADIEANGGKIEITINKPKPVKKLKSKFKKFYKD